MKAILLSLVTASLLLTAHVSAASNVTVDAKLQNVNFYKLTATEVWWDHDGAQEEALRIRNLLTTKIKNACIAQKKTVVYRECFNAPGSDITLFRITCMMACK